jgi:hypothetical protein
MAFSSSIAMLDDSPNFIRIEVPSGTSVLVDYLELADLTNPATDKRLEPGISVTNGASQGQLNSSAEAGVGWRTRQVELGPTLYEDSTLLLLRVNTTHPLLCSRKYTVCEGNLSVDCVDQNALERVREGPLPGDRYIRCPHAFLPCTPNSTGVTVSCLVKVVVEIGGLLGNLETGINSLVVSGTGIDRRRFWDSIVLMHDFRAEMFTTAAQEARPWATLDCMGLPLTSPTTSLSISFVDIKILVKRCIFLSRRLDSAAIHIQVGCCVAVFNCIRSFDSGLVKFRLCVLAAAFNSSLRSLPLRATRTGRRGRHRQLR